MPGFKDFVTLSVLAESDLDDYLAKQVVMKFATTAARDAALAAVLREGMVAYMDDANRLSLYDGSGWIILAEPEQTYTPALANVTLGTPGQVNTGSYTRSNGFCDFRTRLVLGTGGLFTGTVTIGLPVATGLTIRGFHRVAILDSGTANYEGTSIGEAAAATAVSPCVVNSAGTYIALANINATTPQTWAVNDVLEIQGRFKMNSLYL